MRECFIKILFKFNFSFNLLAFSSSLSIVVVHKKTKNKTKHIFHFFVHLFFSRQFCDIALSCLLVSEAPSMPWVEWAASMGWTTWTWTTPTSTLSTTSTLGRSSDWQMTFCPSHSPEVFEEQNIQNTKAR